MKKMKIIFISNVVVMIALIVIMLTLKDGYKTQALTVVRQSTKAYTDEVNKTLFAQGQFVDEWNLVWELVFETVNSSDRSLAAFDKKVTELESTYLADAKNKEKLEKWGLKELKLNITSEKTKRVISLAGNPVVTFDFTGGSFKSVDYKALRSVSPSEMFKIKEPAVFNFNAQ
jgi:hypothetical protein